jgi:hypothetical protein
MPPSVVCSNFIESFHSRENEWWTRRKKRAQRQLLRSFSFEPKCLPALFWVTQLS